jgi:mRNA-degrading endonuclease toxin of MazEF toxin-antitoxin module
MNQNGKKDFDGWIEIKKEIHFKGSIRTIKEGEIWWCKIGENVGKEICGKGKDFLRPVLIVRKLNKYSFIGVPLTSKEHEGDWYKKFKFKNKDEFAVLAQVENVSVHRLHYKMGEVPQSDLDAVLVGLRQLFE